MVCTTIMAVIAACDEGCYFGAVILCSCYDFWTKSDAFQPPSMYRDDCMSLSGGILSSDGKASMDVIGFRIISPLYY